MTVRASLRVVSAALVIGGLVLSVVPDGATAASTLAPRSTPATPGMQGTDTRIAATPSAMTLHGRGRFAGLSVSVNQTRNLSNQSVSLSWSGATQTVAAPSRFGAEFLQVFQCWGDDDGTNPDNPGPPPQQCEQGAVAGQYGGVPSQVYPGGYALTRLISRTTWANRTDPFVVANGVADPTDRYHLNIWMPFRAVDGTVVNVPSDQSFNPSVLGGNYWLNPYYNIITTNEIPAASTGPDGEGAELFQVLTGIESAGLGCGTKVQPVPGGGKKAPKCWLVVVPRGEPNDENAGTPFGAELGVYTSPLSPAAWANRIAFPLEFNPVESSCDLSGDQLRISGSEVALAAVASWQVALCGKAGLLPFSYAPVSDDAARLQLQSGVDGGPSMIVVQRPLASNNDDPSNPVVYAPLTESGLAIGFNVERNPALYAPPAEAQLAGVRVAHMNLTPRLVAKLLTQSYGQAVTMGGPSPYTWSSTAPSDLSADPDFLRFNPEFTLLQMSARREFSGLSLEAGNSDAAAQVWSWVLSDPEARRWMAGTPDEWGMKVNPVYLTTSANSTGIPFASPLPNSFPKSEPHCFQADPVGVGNPVIPPALCGTDWNPYSRSFLDTARIVRQAYDGAKIAINSLAQAPSDVWKRDTPQVLGTRAGLGVVDTAAAVQFGLQTASLSRAGDNGDDREFIAPDATSIGKGVAAMKSTGVAGVLEPDHTKVAPGAYPLAMLSYAAIKPLSLSSAVRRQFATFLSFAATEGQISGLELGKLPRGFSPLNPAMRAQLSAAANRVRTITAPPTTSTSTTMVYSGGGGIDTGGAVDTTAAPASTSTSTSTTAPSSATTTVGVATSVAMVTDSSLALTPATPASAGRLVVPGLGIAAFGSLLGVVGIGTTPRRRTRRQRD